VLPLFASPFQGAVGAERRVRVSSAAVAKFRFDVPPDHTLTPALSLEGRGGKIASDSLYSGH
jgi:hypothetical protein